MPLRRSFARAILQRQYVGSGLKAIWRLCASSLSDFGSNSAGRSARVAAFRQTAKNSLLAVELFQNAARTAVLAACVGDSLFSWETPRENARFGFKLDRLLARGSSAARDPGNRPRRSDVPRHPPQRYRRSGAAAKREEPPAASLSPEIVTGLRVMKSPTGLRSDVRRLRKMPGEIAVGENALQGARRVDDHSRACRDGTSSA